VTYTDIFQQLLSNISAYRLLSTDETYSIDNHLSKRTTQFNGNLDHAGHQHSKLVISVKPLDSHNHNTVYHNYDIEQANEVVSKVEINGLSHFNRAVSFKFDLSNYDDKQTLYENFISHMNGNTFSKNNISAYRFVSNGPRLPSFEEYWTNLYSSKKVQGKVLVIDLRAGCGFSQKPEPLLTSDKIHVKIDFKKGLNFNYHLSNRLYYPVQWALGIPKGRTEPIIMYTDETNSTLVPRS